MHTTNSQTQPLGTPVRLAEFDPHQVGAAYGGDVQVGSGEASHPVDELIHPALGPSVRIG